VVAVGSQHSFSAVQQFLHVTDFATVPILWEQTGNLWRINDVRTNSAMQLYSFDLRHQTDLVFFNDEGRAIFLDAALQTPWSPVDRTPAP